MREGWEYKKLGEVGTFLRGKSIQKADFVEHGLPCIHYGQIHTKFGVSVDKHLSEIPEEVYNKSIIASPGDVVIAITSEDLDGSCKSTAWLGDYDVAVSSHAAVYKHNLNPKFIAYYLRSNSFYVEKGKYARGFKVMEIKPTDIARIPIPLPSEEIQSRVVAELDKINELIRLKKEQLKDYDNLAQSIFYEMFGDPVVNEKGWEVKHIGDFGTCIAGATPSTTVEEYWINGTIPWLSSGEVSKGRIFNTDKRITQHGYNSCSTRMIPAHTIVIAMAGQGKTRGTVGVAEIPLCTNQSICSIVTNEKIDVDFLYYQIKFLYNELRSASNGDGGRGGLNLRLIQKFPIISPNYSIQVSFAKRIKTVELLKSNIQTTIADLETLLASRMQYWFD